MSNQYIFFWSRIYTFTWKNNKWCSLGCFLNIYLNEDLVRYFQLTCQFLLRNESTALWGLNVQAVEFYWGSNTFKRKFLWKIVTEYDFADGKLIVYWINCVSVVVCERCKSPGYSFIITATWPFLSLNFI